MRGLPIKRPKSLLCGMLEDGGRTLFLLRKDETGVERLEMPCVESFSSGNSAELATEFKRQTGIDAEVHEIAMQGKHNAGSRKRKFFIPALVFKLTAKNRSAKPSAEFSGFRWLSMEDAKAARLGRKLAWIRALSR